MHVAGSPCHRWGGRDCVPAGGSGGGGASRPAHHHTAASRRVPSPCTAATICCRCCCRRACCCRPCCRTGSCTSRLLLARAAMLRVGAAAAAAGAGEPGGRRAGWKGVWEGVLGPRAAPPLLCVDGPIGWVARKRDWRLVYRQHGPVAQCSAQEGAPAASRALARFSSLPDLVGIHHRPLQAPSRQRRGALRLWGLAAPGHTSDSLQALPRPIEQRASPPGWPM